jgi:hypothetical protein
MALSVARVRRMSSCYLLQLFRRGPLADIVQARRDLGQVFVFNTADDGCAAALKVIEMDAMILSRRRQNPPYIRPAWP